MGAKNYDWVRYWQQRDGRPVPPATGFLPEVQSDWFFSEDTYCRLSELDHVRCLVLLGEPGMGKTREVTAEVARLEEARRSVGFYDLKALASADRLEKRIFGGEKFQALCGGTSDLTLFLDSIDEGRVVIKAVTDVLAEELSASMKSDHVSAGLRLRITCRSKDWQDSFGGDLQRIFRRGPGPNLAPAPASALGCGKRGPDGRGGCQRADTGNPPQKRDGFGGQAGDATDAAGPLPDDRNVAHHAGRPVSAGCARALQGTQPEEGR